MTPQLQQAIKMLALTHLEMTNMIAEEMTENPMLEELEGGQGEQEAKSESDYTLEKLEKQNVEASSEDFGEPNDLGKRDDFDFERYIESYNAHSSSLPPSMATPEPADGKLNYENTIPQEITLSEHLEWQLRMENLTPKEWEVAVCFIHNINDNGHLEISVEEVCEQANELSDEFFHSQAKRKSMKKFIRRSTGHDPEDALEILKMIQSLDPVGCGARSLQECLLVQAQKLQPRMPLVERIISECLELKLLEHKDLIAQQLGVEYQQVSNAEMVIRGLNPKPGRLISSEATHYVIPDIFVRDVGGELKIEVNDEGVPRLRISRPYRKILHTAGGDKSTKQYVRDKLRNALWLIKSIQNRQSTIYKVGEAIVRHQPDFFRKGPAFLRPMNPAGYCGGYRHARVHRFPGHHQ